jgi:exodeoxyribonuclease V alpha subunit
MDTTAGTEVKARLVKEIFTNENGFLIGAFYAESEKKEICALGSMLNPTIDADYTLYGRWTDHHQYGKQFQFASYKTEQPQTVSGIYKYLLRIAKWIGPAIGNKLVDTYEGQTLTVLKENPELVAATIPGITLERAAQVQKILVDNEKTESAMVELEPLFAVPGMRKSLIFDVVKRYGANAPAKVKENPYRLTRFRGIGFRTADTVAIVKIGIDRDSMFRKMAAAEYVISELMQASGSVWIHREAVVSTMRDILGIEAVEDGIDTMITHEKIAVFDVDYLSLAKKATNESLIAHKIALMIIG